MFDPDAMSIPTVEELSLRLGDKFTMAGIYLDMPNPARRWWAFWRPRRIASSDLQTYRVVGSSSSVISL